MASLLITLLAALAVAALLLRRRKLGAVLAAMALAWALAAGCGPLANALLERLQTHPTPTVAWKNRNAIVLLGGGVVHWPAEGRYGPSAFGYPRAFEAARQYFACRKASAQCTVLAAGGDLGGTGVSEAEVLKTQLESVGVPAADILVENRSRNTFQNAQFAAPILHGRDPDLVVLVTSGTHLRRALLLFERFGLQAVGAPADRLDARHSLLPLAYNVLLADLALHEYVGMLRYRLYELLGWNALTGR